MKVFLCSGCNRHVKDATCPFCGGSAGDLVGDSSFAAPGVSRGAIVVAAAATVAISLALVNCSSAAYGCAPYPECARPDAGADAGAD